MGNASGEVSECADFVFVCVSSNPWAFYSGIITMHCWPGASIPGWCRAVPALGLSKHWGDFHPTCTVREGTPMGLQAGCAVLSSSQPQCPGDEFSAWFSLILVGIRVLLTIPFYSLMDFVS